MSEHVVKCWIPYFEAIDRGDKSFDVRRDDRGYQKGDTLVLEKYDGKHHRYVMDGYNFSAKPYRITRTITYVLTGGQFGIEPGYVVLALSPSDRDTP